VPIYDLTYRRASLERRAGGAFGPVFGQSLRYAFRSRWTKGIFVAAWLPALVFISIVYVQTGFVASLGREGPNLTLRLGTGFSYLRLLQIEEAWLLLLACAVGAGLLAEDRRANALELYFARPLTRFEYLSGKFAALVAILFGVTGLPAIVVWLFDVLLAPDWSRFSSTWDWPLRFAAYGLVLAGVTASVMLALSAVSKGGRHAAVYFAILFFLSPPVGHILAVLTRERSVRAIGYQPALNSIGEEIFGVFQGRGEPPAGAAFAVLLVAVLLSAVVTWTRTSPSEVVR
jgi:ABC-2 type transport system permease protein